ncbi:MAG: response regulator [Candidatus Nucleicultricaceae bacterium]
MIKILVVDDEEDLDILVMQRFRKQIQQKLYQFYFARDGEEALRVIDRNPDISIVASDLNMPQMNGLELLTHLKEHYPHIKSMIVSAYSDTENISLAMKEGACAFITKPINFDQFEQKIIKLSKEISSNIA